MLLPVDLRDWLPEDHLAHFIVDAVAELPLEGAKVNAAGTGSAQYPPSMLLALLIYAYATGRFSSREIERATHGDVAMRYLSANTHPDHDTLCTFRRNHQALFEQAFTRVLELAQGTGLLRVGNIAVDGTKILANASKHKAVSHERSGELIELLEREVRELLARAEAADSAPLADGLTIPGELKRRQARLERLRAARAEIEARVAEKTKKERAEYERKLAARTAKKERGERTGRPPSEPGGKPEGKEQVNFTDEESRVMKVGSGQRFEQSYNAQAAVDLDGGSRLILGARVTNHPTDKQELAATVASVCQASGAVPAVVVADNGFYSEEAVKAVEKNGGTTVYAALEKEHHGRTLADLEVKPEVPAPAPTAPMKERMAHRLASARGKALCALRKSTIEPVFGIIKEAMGFRRFSMRGQAKAGLEWTLVCLSYNLRRLKVLGLKFANA